MDSAIQWAALVVQVAGAAIAAWAAWSAWQAAKASRGVVEAQRRAEYLGRLDALHGAVLDVQRILGEEPVRAHEFDAARRTVKRYVVLFPKDKLPGADRLASDEPATHETTAGWMLHPDAVPSARQWTRVALMEVEQLLETQERPPEVLTW